MAQQPAAWPAQVESAKYAVLQGDELVLQVPNGTTLLVQLAWDGAK